MFPSSKALLSAPLLHPPAPCGQRSYRNFVAAKASTGHWGVLVQAEDEH